MKRLMMVGLVVAGLASMGSAVAVQDRPEAGIDKAVVNFQTKVLVLDATLQGNYLFVHDQNKMVRGEACTSVYEFVDGTQGKLVASFHCTPVQRRLVTQFTCTLQMIGPDLDRLKEFQFAGSTEGHRVPTKG